MQHGDEFFFTCLDVFYLIWYNYTTSTATATTTTNNYYYYKKTFKWYSQPLPEKKNCDDVIEDNDLSVDS